MRNILLFIVFLELLLVSKSTSFEGGHLRYNVRRFRRKILADRLHLISINEFDCSSFADRIECVHILSKGDRGFHFPILPIIFGVPLTLLCLQRLNQIWTRRSRGKENDRDIGFDPILFDEDGHLPIKEVSENSALSSWDEDTISSRNKLVTVKTCPQCAGKGRFLKRVCDLCDGEGSILLQDDNYYLPESSSISSKILSTSQPEKESEDSFTDDDNI